MKRLLSIVLTTLILLNSTVCIKAEENDINTNEIVDENEVINDNSFNDGIDTNEDNIISSLTYIDPNIDNSLLEHKDSSKGILKANLESSYKVPDEYITSVKNQNPYGTCWAFACAASAESTYLKTHTDETNIDLSELQLAFYLWHNLYQSDDLGLITKDGNTTLKIGKTSGNTCLDTGGNSYIAAFEMMSGIGFIDESTLKYSKASDLISSLSIDYDLCYQSKYYPTKIVFYNLNENNGKTVKNALKEYGALAISYFHQESEENYTNYGSQGYCYYQNSESDSNHAVTLVGWDDNFSKENFNSNNRPSNNGAWLIKNSWGTGYGDSGYMWISYEDKSLLDSVATQFFIEKSNNMNIYQYDGSSYCNSMYNFSNKSLPVGNVYQAQKDEIIKEIGFFTIQADVNYSVDVYVSDSKMSNPTSGTKINEASVPSTRLNYSGFYTVELTKPVELKKGQYFSIVVTLSSDDGVTLMCDETSIGSYSFINHTESKQSFIYENKSWDDAHDDGASVRLKAYTENTYINLDYENKEISTNTEYVLNVTTNSSRDIVWTSSDQSIVSVSGQNDKATIKGIKEGTSTIKCKINDELYDECVVTVTKERQLYIFDDNQYFYDKELSYGYNNSSYSENVDFYIQNNNNVFVKVNNVVSEDESIVSYNKQTNALTINNSGHTYLKYVDDGISYKIEFNPIEATMVDGDLVFTFNNLDYLDYSNQIQFCISSDDNIYGVNTYIRDENSGSPYSLIKKNENEYYLSNVVIKYFGLPSGEYSISYNHDYEGESFYLKNIYIESEAIEKPELLINPVQQENGNLRIYSLDEDFLDGLSNIDNWGNNHGINIFNNDNTYTIKNRNNIKHISNVSTETINEVEYYYVEIPKSSLSGYYIDSGTYNIELKSDGYVHSRGFNYSDYENIEITNDLKDVPSLEFSTDKIKNKKYFLIETGDKEFVDSLVSNDYSSIKLCNNKTIGISNKYIDRINDTKIGISSGSLEVYGISNGSYSIYLESYGFKKTPRYSIEITNAKEDYNGNFSLIYSNDELKITASSDYLSDIKYLLFESGGVIYKQYFTYEKDNFNNIIALKISKENLLFARVQDNTTNNITIESFNYKNKTINYDLSVVGANDSLELSTDNISEENNSIVISIDNYDFLLNLTKSPSSLLRDDENNDEYFDVVKKVNNGFESGIVFDDGKKQVFYSRSFTNNQNSIMLNNGKLVISDISFLENKEYKVTFKAYGYDEVSLNYTVTTAPIYMPNVTFEMAGENIQYYSDNEEFNNLLIDESTYRQIYFSSEYYSFFDGYPEVIDDGGIKKCVITSAKQKEIGLANGNVNSLSLYLDGYKSKRINTNLVITNGAKTIPDVTFEMVDENLVITSTKDYIQNISYLRLGKINNNYSEKEIDIFNQDIKNQLSISYDGDMGKLTITNEQLYGLYVSDDTYNEIYVTSKDYPSKRFSCLLDITTGIKEAPSVIITNDIDNKRIELSFVYDGDDENNTYTKDYIQNIKSLSGALSLLDNGNYCFDILKNKIFKDDNKIYITYSQLLDFNTIQTGVSSKLWIYNIVSTGYEKKYLYGVDNNVILDIEDDRIQPEITNIFEDNGYIYIEGDSTWLNNVILDSEYNFGGVISGVIVSQDNNREVFMNTEDIDILDIENGKLRFKISDTLYKGNSEISIYAKGYKKVSSDFEIKTARNKAPDVSISLDSKNLIITGNETYLKSINSILLGSDSSSLYLNKNYFNINKNKITISLDLINKYVDVSKNINVRLLSTIYSNHKDYFIEYNNTNEFYVCKNDITYEQYHRSYIKVCSSDKDYLDKLDKLAITRTDEIDLFITEKVEKHIEDNYVLFDISDYKAYGENADYSVSAYGNHVNDHNEIIRLESIIGINNNEIVIGNITDLDDDILFDSTQLSDIEIGD